MGLRSTAGKQPEDELPPGQNAETFEAAQKAIQLKTESIEASKVPELGQTNEAKLRQFLKLPADLRGQTLGQQTDRPVESVLLAKPGKVESLQSQDESKQPEEEQHTAQKANERLEFNQLLYLDTDIVGNQPDDYPGTLAKFVKSNHMGHRVKHLGTVTKVNAEKRTVEFDISMAGTDIAYTIQAIVLADDSGVFESLANNSRSWKNKRQWEKERFWVVGIISDVSVSKKSRNVLPVGEPKERNTILLEKARIYREADMK
jgi:hypothetical protein